MRTALFRHNSSLLDGTHSPQNIALYAFALGSIFGVGFGLGFLLNNFAALAWFFAFMAFFHTFEYIPTAMYRHNDLDLSSFMLDHSPEFKFAFAFSVVEFLLENAYFPHMKQMGYLQYLGLLVAVVGQALRTIAQFTAGSNFTHQIAEYKQKDHVLVTSGIYKYLRHPSYTGFFYWGIGLQILLSNPISFLGFVIVLWKFFDQRILIEEQRLVEFFGGEYKEYRKQAKVYIPFIP